MAAVTIHSDFGAQENKSCHCCLFFPICEPWSGGTECHDLCVLNTEFEVCLVLYNCSLSSCCDHSHGDDSGPFLSHKASSCRPCYSHSCVHPPRALKTTALFSTSVIFLFQECYLSFSLSIMHLRSFQVVVCCIMINRFPVSCYIHLLGIDASPCLTSHTLWDIWLFLVFLKFYINYYKHLLWFNVMNVRHVSRTFKLFKETCYWS